MFEGDWGYAPTSKTAQIGKHRSERFLQCVATLALLAKANTNLQLKQEIIQERAVML